MQHMSYLDRREKLEDYLREGPPPPPYQLSDYNSYLKSNIEQQVNAAQLEEDSWGNEIDPEVFYQIGHIMATEYQLEPEPEAKPEPTATTSTDFEDKYSSKQELKKLADFIYYHFKNAANLRSGQTQKEDPREWLMSDESTTWLMECFQDNANKLMKLKREG